MYLMQTLSINPKLQETGLSTIFFVPDFTIKRKYWIHSKLTWNGSHSFFNSKIDSEYEKLTSKMHTQVNNTEKTIWWLGG